MAKTVCAICLFERIEQLAEALLLPDKIDVGVRFPNPPIEIPSEYKDEKQGYVLYYSHGFKQPKQFVL